MLRIQACTAAGCTYSTPSSVRTLEAPPQAIDKPVLTPFASVTGSHDGVRVVWDPPRKPNGDITEYRIERRQVFPTADGVFT